MSAAMKQQGVSSKSGANGQEKDNDNKNGGANSQHLNDIRKMIKEEFKKKGKGKGKKDEE